MLKNIEEVYYIVDEIVQNKFQKNPQIGPTQPTFNDTQIQLIQLIYFISDAKAEQETLF